jgi:hypothetical protein
MRASRQHRTRPQTPASRQFGRRLKIFSDCKQKAAERRYIFGKYNGLRRGLETVAKGTEKSNNLAGNLTGWRASHRPAAAHR